MAWEYTIHSSTATHLGSGAVFEVVYRSRNIQSVDDLDLIPTKKGKSSSDDIAKLKQDLWHHIEAEQDRGALLAMIQKDFLGDYQRAAQAITGVSGQKVSERTIQAWLIDPSRVSSRKCPVWAVKALRDYLAVPENRRNLAELAEYREQIGQQRSRINDVIDRHQVRMATTEIEVEHANRQRWAECSFNELPTRLFELEKRFADHLEYLNCKLSAVMHALETSSTFEDFKRQVKDKINEEWMVSNVVRNARRAIEDGTHEFADEEGVENHGPHT